MKAVIQHIALYGLHIGNDAIPHVARLLAILREKKINLVFYKPFKEELLKQGLDVAESSEFSTHENLKGNADLLCSLGGDGTMLETISLIRDSGIPVLGINTGRLGFLSSIAKEEVDWAMQELFAGHYFLANRSLLQMNDPEHLFGDLNFAMNEFTVHKKDTSSMIAIHTWVDGEFLNTYWADGLIIATPTGSTGYSMSCGGPIIHPTTGNFVITPIAPHNLTMRPIIVPDSSVIKLVVEGRHDSFLATLDSRSVTMNTGIEMTVKRETFSIQFVRLKGQSFLSTLRNKLMWGMDKRN
ncbi:MAG: NAD kinase [Flavobacteriales bacterium]|nr:NAD kinase [Flavobacteriales bacterium]MCB9449469.1 NAD kinase [Flavobacteriales bacterium]